MCKVNIVVIPVGVAAIMLVMAASHLLGYANSSCQQSGGAACSIGDETTSGGCASVGSSGGCNTAWALFCDGEQNGTGYFCVPNSGGPSCTGNGSTTPCGDQNKRPCYWQTTTAGHGYCTVNMEINDATGQPCTVEQCTAPAP